MKKQTCVKVTLSTGKVVLMREMRIEDTELAAKEMASKADGDQYVLTILMQKALVKNLLISVEGKVLEPMDKENLNAHFSMGEYTQLSSVVKELMGGEEAAKKPLFETVCTGDSSHG